MYLQLSPIETKLLSTPRSLAISSGNSDFVELVKPSEIITIKKHIAITTHL